MIHHAQLDYSILHTWYIGRKCVCQNGSCFNALKVGSCPWISKVNKIPWFLCQMTAVQCGGRRKLGLHRFPNPYVYLKNIVF